MGVHKAIQSWAQTIRYGARQMQSENLESCVRCGAVSIELLQLRAWYMASDNGDPSMHGFRKALNEILAEFCHPKTEKLNGHHHDYAKPTDVVALCVSCHWKTHNELRSKKGQLDMFKPF